MSGSEKAGNGRGSNRKRPFRRRNKDNNSWQEDAASEKNTFSHGGGASRSPTSAQKARGPAFENQSRHNQGSPSKRGGENSRGEKPPFVDRPKWVPPKPNTDPLPAHDCSWCGKPIRDITLAISDKDSGAPIHFECVTARIAGGENLDKGDVVTYIGGGRFGIVYFGNSGESPGEPQAAGSDFKIKKIIEWENKDKRAEWRSVISDHYSITT